MIEKEQDLVAININPTKNKQLFTLFQDRIFELESNLGALCNMNKDYTDNHKFNYLRHSINLKRIKRGLRPK